MTDNTATYTPQEWDHALVHRLVRDRLGYYLDEVDRLMGKRPSFLSILASIRAPGSAGS